MPNEESEPPEYWVSTRLKHLEMIQNIIDRMTVASSQAKVASTGILTAVVSLAAAISTPSVVLFAAPVILILAVLDAYYLSLERGYRARFDIVRQKPINGPADFDMARDKTETVWAATASFSIWPFYAALVALATIAFIFVGAVEPVVS